MLTKLRLKLKYPPDEKLNYNISSNMHGILMGVVDNEYGSILHEDSLKPFAQDVSQIENNTFIWTICTLTDKAKKNIIDKLIEKDEFIMEHRNIKLTVTEKSVKYVTYDELVNQYYFKEQPRKIHLYFYSPTAFKSHGTYIFMPTVRLIFQSLIQKYDEFSKDLMVGSEEIMEHIEKYVQISGYKLRSVRFSVEGIRIPAFIGSISLYVKGPHQMVNLIRMLTEFGSYSGIGIKTSLGMGAVEIKEV